MAGRIRGKIVQRARSKKIRLLVQSRPTQQLYCAPLQVEILCQNCLDIRSIRVMGHGSIEFDYAAEFIAAAIIRIGQPELRVVLCRHGYRLRLPVTVICEPSHRKVQFGPRGPLSLRNSDCGHNRPRHKPRPPTKARTRAITGVKSGAYVITSRHLEMQCTELGRRDM